MKWHLALHVANSVRSRNVRPTLLSRASNLNVGQCFNRKVTNPTEVNCESPTQSEKKRSQLRTITWAKPGYVGDRISLLECYLCKQLSPLCNNHFRIRSTSCWSPYDLWTNLSCARYDRSVKWIRFISWSATPRSCTAGLCWYFGRAVSLGCLLSNRNVTSWRKYFKLVKHPWRILDQLLNDYKWFTKR